MTYTPDGVKPDPSKVDAIKKIEPPFTKQELQSFVGMVNYLSSYIPQVRSNIQSQEPPQGFLFQWTETHETEFQLLKRAITKDANLQYVNPKKEVTLQVDASQVGLGAALLQDSKVIA